MTAIPIGRAKLLKEGGRIAILAFGSMVNQCVEAANELGATLVNMRFVKPLDADLVKSVSERHDLLVTVEENAVAGGAGSGINELLAASGIPCEVLNIGIPDKFIEHGARDDCLAMAGLDPRGIRDQIEKRLRTMGLAVRLNDGVMRDSA